jgi:hypothetical protein
VAAAMGKFANAFLQGLGILKSDENIENWVNVPCKQKIKI